MYYSGTLYASAGDSPKARVPAEWAVHSRTPVLRNSKQFGFRNVPQSPHSAFLGVGSGTSLTFLVPRDQTSTWLPPLCHKLAGMKSNAIQSHAAHPKWPNGLYQMPSSIDSRNGARNVDILRRNFLEAGALCRKRRQAPAAELASLLGENRRGVQDTGQPGGMRIPCRHRDSWKLGSPRAPAG